MTAHYIVVTPDDNLCRPVVTSYHDEYRARKLFRTYTDKPCDCEYCSRFMVSFTEIDMECLLPKTLTVKSVVGGSSVTYPVEFFPVLTWDGLTIPSCMED